MVNDTDQPVEYGRLYELDRRDDSGAFRPLDPPVCPFTSDLLHLPPRSVSDPDQIGPTIVQNGQERPLEPGAYRVRRRFRGRSTRPC